MNNSIDCKRAAINYRVKCDKQNKQALWEKKKTLDKNIKNSDYKQWKQEFLEINS